MRCLLLTWLEKCFRNLKAEKCGYRCISTISLIPSVLKVLDGSAIGIGGQDISAELQGLLPERLALE